MSLAGRLNPLRPFIARIRLSRAKHPSLAGHPRLALAISRWVRLNSYSAGEFFSSDSAPPDIVQRRRISFDGLARLFRERAPRTIALSDELEHQLSDLAFVNTYRVPFQYQEHVHARLKLGAIAVETDGARVRDMDGNWSYDLSGSYGVNLFGSAFYKGCIDRGVARARDLGLVLGAYHPLIADNAARLKEISQLDEVSFHMSGTEAVMQAVRLARYHTRRSHAVRFAGAYHGWWDGVQAGAGNPKPARDIYTLKEMHADTLCVLRTRNDIACVLVNPIQALNPNGMPANDSSLIAGERAARFDRETYTRWLGELRQVCTERSIVLIFDEVFLGFRLARGGAQEYFGVRADIVTYGKSLGGGLPVGAVCGKAELMRRFNSSRPMDVCFARGTFNSHPYVMATMNEFLRHLDEPKVRQHYDELDAVWDRRALELNRRLQQLSLPVRVANMTSVWTTLYMQPGRYHWMFQYYLRAHGLAMSWIGTGRFIFSHDLTNDDFNEIARRFVAAACEMKADGWWWGGAELTAKAIHRRVLRELLNAGLGRAPSGRAIVPAAGTAEPCGISSHRETGPSGSW